MTDYEVEIIKVINQTHNVKTLRLYRPSKFDFISGQYVLITNLKNPKLAHETRPFTLSSSPIVTNYLELTVKLMDGFTSELFKLEKGDRLKISGPMGETLNYSDEISGDVVFIAGGSGITPFMSAIRYAKDLNLKNHITLFFGNKTKEDIIFNEELKKIQEGFLNLNVVHVLSQESKENWSGELGRIDQRIIKKYIKNMNSNIWYLCGPPPMVRAMKTILDDLGIKKSQIRVEEWQMPGKEESLENQNQGGVDNMTKKNEIYKCEVCGNVIEVLEIGGGPLVCCGKPMTLLEEKTGTEEGKEKHIPVIEVDGSKVTIKVGSVDHPMEDNHYIQAIEVFAEGELLATHRLNPGDDPIVEGEMSITKGLTARALCNIHGLWKSKESK